MRDRRVTPDLLRLLEDAGLPEGAGAVVADGLIDLVDVRAEASAWRILHDGSATPVRRRAAAEILDRQGVLPNGTTLLEWWASGDEVLAEVALGQAHLGTARIVREAWGDCDPKRRAAAIEALKHGFNTREWTDLVVAALDDDHPDVRSAAIGSCLFTEPHRALDPLLAATHDDDPEVVVEALDVLRWYGSRRALRRSAQLGVTLGC